LVLIARTSARGLVSPLTFPLWAGNILMHPDMARGMILENFVAIYLVLNRKNINELKSISPAVAKLVDEIAGSKPSGVDLLREHEELLTKLGMELVKKRFVRAEYTMPPPLFRTYYPRGLACREFWYYIDKIYSIVARKKITVAPATLAVPKMAAPSEELTEVDVQSMEALRLIKRTSPYEFEFSDCARASSAFLLPTMSIQPIPVVEVPEAPGALKKG
ncbi:MAG: hypothetical protein ACP5I3_12040, partial [Thermoproteus sp.]